MFPDIKLVVRVIAHGIYLLWRDRGTVEPDWRMKDTCTYLPDLEVERAGSGLRLV